MIYTILSATDVNKEPKQSYASERSSGRLIEVEKDEEPQETIMEGVPKHVYAKRCLKLGLLNPETKKLVIGIELRQLNWNRSVEELVGKHLRLIGAVKECEGALLLAGSNCEIIDVPVSLDEISVTGPAGSYDLVDDDLIMREVIDIE